MACRSSSCLILQRFKCLIIPSLNSNYSPPLCMNLLYATAPAPADEKVFQYNGVEIKCNCIKQQTTTLNQLSNRQKERSSTEVRPALQTMTVVINDEYVIRFLFNKFLVFYRIFLH